MNKIFLKVSVIWSVITAIVLIITNMAVRDINVVLSFLFVLPSSISVGSAVFFVSRLTLPRERKKTFNVLLMVQICIYAALSLTALAATASSAVVEWSGAVGVLEILAQIALVFLCAAKLFAKKALKKVYSVALSVFVTAVYLAITVNSLLPFIAQGMGFDVIMESLCIIFAKLQFAIVSLYVAYEK